MDQLPEEVFEIILLYAGGEAFLNLRCTCERFKMISDDVERRSKTCIWYRYTFAEFPRACIQSIVPWLPEDDENSMNWKAVYLYMSRFKIQPKRMQFSHITLPYHCSDSVRYMIFAGKQLFIARQGNKVSSYGIVNLKNKDPSKLMPITYVLQCEEQDRENHIHYDDDVITQSYLGNRIFEPLHLTDQKNSWVIQCKNKVKKLIDDYAVYKNFLMESKMKSMPMDISTFNELMSFMVDKTVQRVCCRDTDGSKILVFGRSFGIRQRPRAISFGTQLSTGPDEPLKFVLSQFNVRNDVRVLRIFGNLIICFFGKNESALCTNVWMMDATGHVSLGEWNPITLDGLEEEDCVAGFDILGQVLVVLTQRGKVFVSHFGEPRHECIQENIFMAHELTTDDPTRCFNKICVDINDGLVMAVSSEKGHIHLLLAN